MAFEIPIATFLLVWIGIVDVATLRKSRPYVIVGCFLVGMLLTPPDIFSQTLMAIPMWFLFEIGVLFGSIIQKEREEKEAEESNPSASNDQTPSVKS